MKLKIATSRNIGKSKNGTSSTTEFLPYLNALGYLSTGSAISAFVCMRWHTVEVCLTKTLFASYCNIIGFSQYFMARIQRSVQLVQCIRKSLYFSAPSQCGKPLLKLNGGLKRSMESWLAYQGGQLRKSGLANSASGRADWQFYPATCLHLCTWLRNGGGECSWRGSVKETRSVT